MGGIGAQNIADIVKNLGFDQMSKFKDQVDKVIDDNLEPEQRDALQANAIAEGPTNEEEFLEFAENLGTDLDFNNFLENVPEGLFQTIAGGLDAGEIGNIVEN